MGGVRHPSHGNRVVVVVVLVCLVVGCVDAGVVLAVVVLRLTGFLERY